MKLVSLVAVLFAMQAYADGSIICESMTTCRAPPMTVYQYEVPVLAFDATGPTPITLTANVWWTSGCPGAPDLSFPGTGDVPDAGHWYSAPDTGSRPDGTNYSIQWTIDGCPPLDCMDGIIGSVPDICQ